MANGLNKHHILEAIDKLRSRKSRPDVFRIVSYVSKKYEFPKNDIKEYLESLSKDGTVLKVEFKGSFSYRNAANQRYSSTKTVSPTSEEESSRSHESIGDLVAGTLAKLIVEEPDYLDVGISMNELYDHIDNKVKKTLTKSYFKEVIQNEVKNGNLVKFENGNFCLGYPSGEPNTMSPNISDASQNSLYTTKEKSKSPLHTIRKYSCLSRHSSPSSSKNSTTSSTSERTSVSFSKKTPKTYAKSNKKIKIEVNKNEISPSREGSRRKRFQKIVFDPSDSPKPKKLKERKGSGVTPGRIRGPYKKHNKEVQSPAVVEKPVKKATSIVPRHSTRNSTVEIKAEVVEPKVEVVSEEESENDSSDVGKICKICNFKINFKSYTHMEKWTTCHFCGKKAHVTCIEDTEQWTRFKLSKWQCNDCKYCVVCKKRKDSEEAGLILCGLCDDAYHLNCANIKKSKVTQKWFCSKCSGVFNDDIQREKEDFGSTEMTSNESSQRTTPEPEEKKTPEKEEPSKETTTTTTITTTTSSQDNEDIDESIPDCSNWSCEEVYSYFSKYVLPEEASIFREQEIDGRVLLLLTRYDVLSDFKLKLGPALKIYAQVKKLQVRKDNPFLFWP